MRRISSRNLGLVILGMIPGALIAAGGPFVRGQQQAVEVSPATKIAVTQQATIQIQPAGTVTAQVSTSPVAPIAFRSEDPAYRSLDANLYMQTSAEYRACCYQTYRLASLQLQAAANQSPEGARAVVIDLDETVIDNSGFQAAQLRSNLSFDIRLWDLWEQTGFDKLALIPGAAEFIAEAKSLGITVVFLSNRNEKFRIQTKAGLKRLGLEILAEDELLLSTNSSNKTARRELVEAKYNVLLYIGDNLRDFDEAFRCPKIEDDPATGIPSPAELEAAINQRKQTVDQHREKFGAKWIIFPNPAYGEWTKPLGQGTRDLERLASEQGE